MRGKDTFFFKSGERHVIVVVRTTLIAPPILVHAPSCSDDLPLRLWAPTVTVVGEVRKVSLDV